jgi:hypothetical protein
VATFNLSPTTLSPSVTSMKSSGEIPCNSATKGLLEQPGSVRRVKPSCDLARPGGLCCREIVRLAGCQAVSPDDGLTRLQPAAAGAILCRRG